MRPSLSPFVFLILPLTLTTAACGGRVRASSAADGGVIAPPDGSVAAVDSGPNVTDGNAPDSLVGTDSGPGDAAMCVDIDPSNFSVSCRTAADCIPALVGQVCTGTCNCGGTGAISGSDEAKYTAALAAIQLDNDCPCVPLPAPICAAGVCTRCNLSSSEPAACMDSGTMDAGIPRDAGGGDGAQCVSIPDLLGSCNVDSDCTLLTTGTLCSGQCDCPNTPVNKSVLPFYEMETASLHFAACPCAAPPPIRCFQGSCEFCGGPGDPSCPDGG